VPHLLHLSCISDGGTADNLTNVIIHTLLDDGGLTQEEIASKIVCFNVDGIQGPQTRIIT